LKQLDATSPEVHRNIDSGRKAVLVGETRSFALSRKLDPVVFSHRQLLSAVLFAIKLFCKVEIATDLVPVVFAAIDLLTRALSSINLLKYRLWTKFKLSDAGIGIFDITSFLLQFGRP